MRLEGNKHVLACAHRHAGDRAPSASAVSNSKSPAGGALQQRGEEDAATCGGGGGAVALCDSSRCQPAWEHRLKEH